MLSKTFLDFEKITGKEYTAYITAGKQDFKIKWREKTISQMLEIIRDFDYDGDPNSLENQINTEIALVKFISSIDKKFKRSHIQKLSQEKVDEIIDKIFDPILKKQETGTAKKKKKSRKTAGIKIMRQIMFLMRYSNGALNHEDALNLTFTQLNAYSNALVYWINNESKKGQKQNDAKERLDDLMELGSAGIEAIKSRAKEFKNKNNTDGR